VIGTAALAGPGPWAWHPHPFLWATVAAAGAGVALLHRRLVAASTHPLRWEQARILRFVGALAVTVVAMGWPLGDLAAHWSLAALVLQRCILVLAVASLLLAGLPDDVIRWATRPAPVDRLILRVVRPPAAVVTVTVLLVGSMAPVLVAAQSRSPVARGLLAVVALVAGIVLWLPIIGRVPGITRPRPMIRAVYLVAQGVVPVFLSFIFILATRPLYPTLAHSRGVVGLAPLNDQQVAGFVSKLSFLITLLAVAAAILVRSPDTDDDLGPEDPLVWADVERHFERADRRGPATAEPEPAPTADGTPAPGDPGPGAPRDVEPSRDPDPGTG
jgi:cytochrome c oxidase assembly factor CtaG